MKVAHFTLWAPFRSGLFEFVLEQVKYEQREGLDSFLIHCDVKNPDPNRFIERGFVAQPWDKAKEADVWVLHRSIPAELMPLLPKKKSVAILHGTSEIMVLHEIESRAKEDKFNMHVEFINTFKKIVCITKSDYDVMKLYDPKGKVVYINDAVDTEVFTIEGFHWEFRYRPAIILTANVRINKNPAFLFWSMPAIMEKIPTARLNVFGLNLTEIRIWKDIVLKASKISTAIENLHHQFYDFKPFLRGADISFNANYNGIFSRDSMEAMACGCSVVAATPEHTPYAYHRQIESIVDAISRAWQDLANDPEGQVLKNRKYAEDHFGWHNRVKDYVKLYQSM